MKKKFILLGILSLGVAYAQQNDRIGINTKQPEGTLDIHPSNTNINGTTNEGIIAPRLTKTRVATIATPIEGTLVYVTDNTYTGSNLKVKNINSKGYYFYDGTEWVKTQELWINHNNSTVKLNHLADGTTQRTDDKNIFITNNGEIGIGTPTPSQKLEVKGNIIISGYVQTSSLDLNSDKRLKNNITTIDKKVTEKIKQLNPVTYYWNSEGKAKGGNDKLQYGLIAQEIERIFPDMVNTDIKGYKSVNYIELIPVLLKAIQEQQKEIEVLKTKIK